VWSAAVYGAAASRAVVAWKDRGRLDLMPVLVAALAACLSSALAALGPDRAAQSAAGSPARTLLVPLPSTAAAVRRRREDVVARLVRGAADALRAGPGPPSVRVVPALALRRGVADAAGLTAAQRRHNLAGRVRLVPGAAALVGGSRVLLVDDVVTTGASAAAAAAVLAAAGANVLALCTVCATPRRAGASPGLSAPEMVV
jgi:predicted amidophosphoribosyltransferase